MSATNRDREKEKENAMLIDLCASSSSEEEEEQDHLNLKDDDDLNSLSSDDFLLIPENKKRQAQTTTFNSLSSMIGAESVTPRTTIRTVSEESTHETNDNDNDNDNDNGSGGGGSGSGSDVSSSPGGSAMDNSRSTSKNQSQLKQGHVPALKDVQVVDLLDDEDDENHDDDYSAADDVVGCSQGTKITSNVSFSNALTNRPSYQHASKEEVTLDSKCALLDKDRSTTTYKKGGFNNKATTAESNTETKLISLNRTKQNFNFHSDEEDSLSSNDDYYTSSLLTRANKLNSNISTIMTNEKEVQKIDNDIKPSSRENQSQSTNRTKSSGPSRLAASCSGLVDLLSSSDDNVDDDDDDDDSLDLSATSSLESKEKEPSSTTCTNSSSNKWKSDFCMEDKTSSDWRNSTTSSSSTTISSSTPAKRSFSNTTTTINTNSITSVSKPYDKETNHRKQKKPSNSSSQIVSLESDEDDDDDDDDSCLISPRDKVTNYKKQKKTSKNSLQIASLESDDDDDSCLISAPSFIWKKKAATNPTTTKPTTNVQKTTTMSQFKDCSSKLTGATDEQKSSSSTLKNPSSRRRPPPPASTTAGSSNYIVQPSSSSYTYMDIDEIDDDDLLSPTAQSNVDCSRSSRYTNISSQPSNHPIHSLTTATTTTTTTTTTTSRGITQTNITRNPYSQNNNTQSSSSSSTPRRNNNNNPLQSPTYSQGSMNTHNTQNTHDPKRRVPTPQIPVVNQIGGKLYPDLRNEFIKALLKSTRETRRIIHQRGVLDASIRAVVVISLVSYPIRTADACARMKGIGGELLSIMRDAEKACSKGKGKPYNPPRGTFCSVAASALVALYDYQVEQGGDDVESVICPMEELIRRVNILTVKSGTRVVFCRECSYYLDKDNLDSGWMQIKKLSSTNVGAGLEPMVKERRNKKACDSGVVFELLEEGKRIAMRLKRTLTAGPVEDGPLRQLASETVDEDYGNVTMSMDFREGGGGTVRLHDMCNLLDEGCVPYVVRNLKISDYVYFVGNKLAPILIERKSVEDVACSLADGRWKRQQHSMRKAQYVLGNGSERRCQICYLIEGDATRKLVHGGLVGRASWNKTLDDVEAAIAELPKLGFSVVKTKSKMESMSRVADIARDVSWKFKNKSIDCKYTYEEFIKLVKHLDDKEGEPPTLAEHQNPAPPIVDHHGGVGAANINNHLNQEDGVGVGVGDDNNNNENGTTILSEEQQEKQKELCKLTIPALKQMCKDRDEKLSGTKKDLITRLLEEPKPTILISRARRGQYVPKVPSCNAAILVALLLNHVPGTEGVTKEKTMYHAEGLGVSRDPMGGKGGWYDGWSGIKDMMNGEIPLVFVNKRKFALTTHPIGSSGVDVAKAIHIMAHRAHLCRCGRHIQG